MNIFFISGAVLNAHNNSHFSFIKCTNHKIPLKSYFISFSHRKKKSNKIQSPSQSQEDANSPSDNNKEEDEASEDESDERIDQASYDPERLKAFNVSN